MVPGGLTDGQRITGFKKKRKKKKSWKESPEVDESNLLLKAGPASRLDWVTEGQDQFSMENLQEWRTFSSLGICAETDTCSGEVFLTGISHLAYYVPGRLFWCATLRNLALSSL